MREEERNSVDEFGEFEELDLASYDEKVYASSEKEESATTEPAIEPAKAVEDVVEESEDDSAKEAVVEMDADAYVAAEFEEMDKVYLINGKKCKERKKRKKLSKQGKIILNSGIACVCLALFLTIAIMFGPLLMSILFAETKTQGLGGAELIVEMSDLPFYFGTEGQVDLTKTFPGGTGFSITEDGGGATIKGATNLTVTEEGEFKLKYNLVGENGSTTAMEVDCIAVQDGVNVADWNKFRNAAASNSIIVMQDNIASPKLEAEKRKNHGAVTIKNDVYGNGKIINVFELVCSRTKVSNKIYGTPYLQGNGKVGGDTGIAIRNKESGERLIFQDVHVTGNDMNTYDPDAVPEGETPEGEVAPTADENKPAGNMKGVTKETIEKRGVLLFSRYGTIVDVAGDEDDKANVYIKHCLFENGAKVLHLEAVDIELEGTIVRNAADTAISIATTANKASYILSRNNVVANSLTGGILFYCFDSNISEANAAETWNTLEVEEGTFLDIFNWKAQSGLAFLPETEDFASIANPIAASEIPKKDYDELKGIVDGQYYIHFAIIKIRTGGGLPRNDSQVIGYDRLGYKTAREIGFTNGFPIPSIAGAIMKDIDVWGYYGNSTGEVTPTQVLGGETDDDMIKFYNELKFGRNYDEAEK